MRCNLIVFGDTPVGDLAPSLGFCPSRHHATPIKKQTRSIPDSIWKIQGPKGPVEIHALKPCLPSPLSPLKDPLTSQSNLKIKKGEAEIKKYKSVLDSELPVKLSCQTKRIPSPGFLRFTTMGDWVTCGRAGVSNFNKVKGPNPQSHLKSFCTYVLLAGMLSCWHIKIKK